MRICQQRALLCSHYQRSLRANHLQRLPVTLSHTEWANPKEFTHKSCWNGLSPDTSLVLSSKSKLNFIRLCTLSICCISMADAPKLLKISLWPWNVKLRCLSSSVSPKSIGPSIWFWPSMLNCTWGVSWWAGLSWGSSLLKFSILFNRSRIS